MSRGSPTPDRVETGLRGRPVAAIALAVGLLATGPVVAQVKVAPGPGGRLLLSNDQPATGSGGAAGVSLRSSRPSSELLRIIERHASTARLDPLLVRAVIEVESGYDPRAVSRKGAMGLMQLMPRTAAQLDVVDPFDPEANIRGGTKYLRLMLDVFEDDLTLALAGYNAGPEAVRRYGGVPPYAETRQYLRRVLSLYRGSEFVDIPDTALDRGRKTFLVRRDGRLVMTTTPPSPR